MNLLDLLDFKTDENKYLLTLPFTVCFKRNEVCFIVTVKMCCNNAVFIAVVKKQLVGCIITVKTLIIIKEFFKINNTIIHTIRARGRESPIYIRIRAKISLIEYYLRCFEVYRHLNRLYLMIQNRWLSPQFFAFY
jgi:hypothetical protein